MQKRKRFKVGQGYTEPPVPPLMGSARLGFLSNFFFHPQWRTLLGKRVFNSHMCCFPKNTYSMLFDGPGGTGSSRIMMKQHRSDSRMYWTSPFMIFRIFLHMLRPKPSCVIHRLLWNISWTSSGGRPSPGHTILQQRGENQRRQSTISSLGFIY